MMLLGDSRGLCRSACGEGQPQHNATVPAKIEHLESNKLDSKLRSQLEGSGKTHISIAKALQRSFPFLQLQHMRQQNNL